MKNTLSVAILSAVAFFGAGTAVSAPTLTLVDWDAPRSVAVRHQDLNLATAHGIDTLHRRIDLAIAKACALPNDQQLSQRARIADCRDTARRQALDQAGRLIGAAQVSARAP